tara:strand:+ start:6477 stop:7325 length:849 start_codon:yes stop_codon:yes gene_type:complete
MKSNQTLKIPFYIVLSVKLLNFFSENLAVKYAAFLFSIPIKFRRPEREKDYYLKSSKRRILIPEIDKKLMVYELENSGPKVLLVHGWSGRATQMYDIAEKCHDSGMHVFSFDLPAHGQSSSSTTIIPEVVSCIRSLYQKIGPFDYAIGHSIGGICIMNSLRFGDKYEKMVTISSPHVNVDMFRDFIFKIGLKEENLDSLLEIFKNKVGASVESYDLIKCAEISKTPTLLLHCEDDRDIPVDCSKESINHFGNGKLILTRGLGHRRILRNKDVVNSILKFLIK